MPSDYAIPVSIDGLTCGLVFEKGENEEWVFGIPAWKGYSIRFDQSEGIDVVLTTNSAKSTLETV